MSGTASAMQTDMTTHVRVVVPDPNAIVTVNGMKTATTGTVREFQSPAPAPGKVYLPDPGNLGRKMAKWRPTTSKLAYGLVVGRL